jgi:succinate-semialdehyde dehydrogenase/glutarate-semialdehyde dehydrogenase
MELGSIAFTVLCGDANLDAALPKVVNAGYRKAGQVCTSIQFLLVQKNIFADVQLRLIDMVKALKYGSPYEEETFVGPVISEAEAIRIEAWINQAVSTGANLLCGGSREGSVLAPVLLTDVNEGMALGCNEIFGPVMCLLPFDTLDEAVDRVNSTPFGLATGVFTNRISDTITASKKLEVGAVHINETSSSRVDLMPYGGSKESGFGREGPRYSVHEMTEERVVTITP